MVIVSLLTVGVGLAVDAYNERQTAKEQRRNAQHQQHYFPTETGPTSRSTDARGEENAFKELQHYADFQHTLSNKILEDGARNRIASDNNIFQYGNQNNNSLAQYMLPIDNSLSNRRHYNRQGALSSPVILPQEANQDGTTGTWPRAYSPSMMECGVDQQTFLKFIDSFNRSLQLSTRLKAVNVANLSSGIGWRDAPQSLAMAIQAAAQVAKSAEPDRSSNQFIHTANKFLFRPRGLFAMVITSSPTSQSQVLTVDCNHSHTFQSANNNIAPSASQSRTNSTSPSRHSSRLRQMGSFVTDYNHAKTPRWRNPSSSWQMFARTPPTTAYPNGGYDPPSFLSLSAKRPRSKDTHMRRRKMGNFRTMPLPTGIVSHIRTSISEGDVGSGSSRPAFGNERNIDLDSDHCNNEESAGLNIQADLLYLVIISDIEEDLIVEEESGAMQWSYQGNDTHKFGLHLGGPGNSDTIMCDVASPPAYTPC